MVIHQWDSVYKWYIDSFSSIIVLYFYENTSPAPLKLDETILLSSDTDENVEFVDCNSEQQR
jgi:hypothetical protein